MARAAAHFAYPWDEAQARQALDRLARAHPQGLWRARLLLDAQGRLQAQAFAMQATPAPVRLQLADRPFEAADSEFVRFKTTRRAHYEAFEPSAPGVFDTLLWNTRGELTECTRGNIALCLDGRWLTPPLASGLLDGVGRQRWLREGRIAEAVCASRTLSARAAWPSSTACAAGWQRSWSERTGSSHRAASWCAKQRRESGGGPEGDGG